MRKEKLKKNEKQNERYKNPDNDPRGPWISTDLLRMEHRDNSVYSVPTPSGKKYIGQSMNIHRRLTQYKRGENKNQVKIHAAICKYG